jgi:type IV secretory pathway TrbF-like protein
MFKRPSIRYGHTPVPETPYQKAAQVVGRPHRLGARAGENWRLMAFGCLALAAGLAGGLVWQAARGRSRPGSSRSTGSARRKRLRRPTPPTGPTDPQIAFHLARFIEEVRAPAVRRGRAASGLAAGVRVHDGSRRRALNDYARRATIPFANARQDAGLRRGVERHPGVAGQFPRRLDRAPLSRAASLAATERWTAILTIVIEPPRDADRLRKNPLGVFVNAINWSKELSQ